jgi:RNA 3'-terminal phosphate cyclase
MRRAFTVYAVLVLALYSVATMRGWELGSSRRGFIPQSVRSSPGGYRTYNYWRGGK